MSAGFHPLVVCRARGAVVMRDGERVITRHVSLYQSLRKVVKDHSKKSG